MSHIDAVQATEPVGGQDPDRSRPGGGMPQSQTQPLPPPRRWRSSGLGERYALVLLTVALFIFFSLLPATAHVFPTAANLRAVFGAQAIGAILAIAALIPLVTDQFDLSVGANLGLAAIMSASVMSSGGGLVLAILVGVGVGCGIGIINGLIITRLHVNPVVATLGMVTIISGLVQAKTGGLSVTSGISSGLVNFASGNFLGIPNLVYAVVVVALCAHYLLTFTPVGRHLYLLGSNPTAARLVGLRPKLLLFLSFVLAGAVAGVGGVLQVGYGDGAQPQLGDNMTLAALAAAFLSASSIKPGRYNVGGALVAITFLAILNSGLNLAGAQPYINSFVNGIALIAGIALASALGRRRAGKR